MQACDVYRKRARYLISGSRLAMSCKADDTLIVFARSPGSSHAAVNCRRAAFAKIGELVPKARPPNAEMAKLIPQPVPAAER